MHPQIKNDLATRRSAPDRLCGRRMLAGGPTSELAVNASTYDIRASTPDAGTMQALRLLWLVLFAMSALITGLVVVAVLCSQKCRAVSFNLLVAGLVFCDSLTNLGFVIVLASNVANNVDTGMPTWACEWLSFWSVFGIAGSCWFNSVIGYEIHSLLSATKQLLHYTPPTRGAVVLRCLGLWLFVAFISSWQLWGVLPHETVIKSGLTCSPADTSPASALFYNFAFVPFAGAIPVVYVFGLGAHSWWRGFLNFELSRKAAILSAAKSAEDIEAIRQRVRQAGSITIFFSRIFFSLVLWLPSVLLTGGDSISVAPLAIGMAWGPLQNIISALTCLSKPDLREAVFGLLTCWVRRRMVAPCTDAGMGSSSSRGGACAGTTANMVAAVPVAVQADAHADAAEAAWVVQTIEEAQTSGDDTRTPLEMT
jgi:hypothetical protein